MNIALFDEVDDHIQDHYAAILAHALRDQNGRVQKVILVAMDFSWVKEEVDTIQLPTNAHLLVIDDTGTVIGGSPNINEWLDKSIAETAFYKQALAAKDSAFDGYGFSGARSIIAAHHFPTGSGNMHIIVDVPYDILLQSVYHDLAGTLLSNVLLLALVLALIYFGSDKLFSAQRVGYQRDIQETCRRRPNG